jgi:hypothetical protein
MWHLAAGAALAIATFGMVLMALTTGRPDPSTLARAGAESHAAGPIQPTPSAADIAASAAAAAALADANNAKIGAIQNGDAVFLASSAQKSFAIKAPPLRPSANKSAEELAIWAERAYPYFVADGPERRAMFAWMVAGTRAGMPRGAALALGIDTVFSGRENGNGVCWPAELPPDRIPKAVTSSQEKVVLGIRCER